MPLQISDKTRVLAKQAEIDLVEQFANVDRVAQRNAEKVLDAFQTFRVTESDFAGTTGYGYDDMGRDKLEQIYAHIFGTESALVRLQFVNGTHAISCALFGAVKPGEKPLYVTGAPYDTLQSVIGITGNAPGTLCSYGVEYGQVELNDQGKPDLPAIQSAIQDPKVRAVVIQRSRGYDTRDSFSVAEIGAICDAVHAVRQDIAILVDNCYGEFVEELEPTQVGADLVMGSLIKNPGGGLAPMGGYLAGREDLIEGAAARLTVPGIGKECGATLGNNRALYQGLFLAPHVTAQAVKTALFAARMMELLGYSTSPSSSQPRYDIIQMIHFGSPEPLKRFCRGIQMGAPVDSYVTPEPWDMPGYDSQVIMAAGAFIQGSSIELSADGPMREPYTAYLQGGLTYESGRLGIMLAVDALLA